MALAGESLGEPYMASPQLPSLAQQLLAKSPRWEGNPHTGTWSSGARWDGLGRHRRQKVGVLIWGLSSAQIPEGLQPLTWGFQHHRLPPSVPSIKFSILNSRDDGLNTAQIGLSSSSLRLASQAETPSEPSLSDGGGAAVA